MFVTSLSFSQNYIDLFRIGYGETFSNSFKGTSSETQVTSADADITFPVVLNDKIALVTGLGLTYNHLQLAPQSEYTSLYGTTLKLGVAATLTDSWSFTAVFLPKIASDYEHITNDDFYIGGYAVAKLRKRDNLIYRFGAYGSTEAFGFFFTPILGWYYLSPNSKFEMDMSLPIVADVNYAISKKITVGIDYFGLGRSYNITNPDLPKVYTQMGSLEFASYIQFGFAKKSILVRAKIGYASTDYEVYNQGDTYSFGLSAIRFNDNRTRLNPEFEGSMFLKAELIYRLSLLNK